MAPNKYNNKGMVCHGTTGEINRFGYFLLGVTVGFVTVTTLPGVVLIGVGLGQIGSVVYVYGWDAPRQLLPQNTFEGGMFVGGFGGGWVRFGPPRIPFLGKKTKASGSTVKTSIPPKKYAALAIKKIKKSYQYYKITKKGSPGDTYIWKKVGECGGAATKFRMRLLGKSNFSADKMGTTFVNTFNKYMRVQEHVFVEYTNAKGVRMRYDPTLSDMIGYSYGKTCVPIIEGKVQTTFTLQEHNAILQHVYKYYGKAKGKPTIEKLVWGE